MGESVLLSISVSACIRDRAKESLTISTLPSALYRRTVRLNVKKRAFLFFLSFSLSISTLSRVQFFFAFARVHTVLAVFNKLRYLLKGNTFFNVNKNHINYKSIAVLRLNVETRPFATGSRNAPRQCNRTELEEEESRESIHCARYREEEANILNVGETDLLLSDVWSRGPNPCIDESL